MVLQLPSVKLNLVRGVTSNRQFSANEVELLLCHEILLKVNPRMPIKIGCSRRALINSEGCDLCYIPTAYVFCNSTSREQPEHLWTWLIHNFLNSRSYNFTIIN